MPEHIIVAYLDGQMSPEERVSFEQTMTTDPELKEAVEQLKGIREQLSLYQGELALRNKIEDIYSQLGEETEPENQSATVRPISLWTYILPIAAAIALLLWIFWPSQALQPPTPEQLFTQTYIPPAAPERMSIGQEDALQILANGHEAYRQKDFESAAALYQEIIQDSLYGSEAAFFQAQSFLALQRYPEAKSALELVNDRVQEVQWYRALIALGQGDIAQCKQLLQPIVSQPSFDFYQEAKKLLDILGQ
ncbi:MAG: hypothetical protein AAF587_24705 [Bacteroidota bacterium]